MPGQAVMSAFFLVSLVTLAFFAEHGWATWDRLRASRCDVVRDRRRQGPPRVAIGIAELVVVLGRRRLVFDLSHPRQRRRPWSRSSSRSRVCLVLLGVAVTALSRTAQQANAFAFTGMVLFGAIGGAFVPFNVLPGWARDRRARHPDLLGDARDALGRPRRPGIGGVIAPTAGALGMSVLFAVVAVWRFRFDEAKTGFV